MWSVLLVAAARSQFENDFLLFMCVLNAIFDEFGGFALPNGFSVSDDNVGLWLQVDE